MPQRLQVLLCVVCKTYQVQIAKKSNKWSCSVCQSKQSVTKVFVEGTGAECRDIVQRLNSARGALEDSRDAKATAQSEAAANFSDFHVYRYQEEHSHINTVPREESKWTKYLDDSD